MPPLLIWWVETLIKKVSHFVCVYMSIKISCMSMSVSFGFFSFLFVEKVVGRIGFESEGKEVYMSIKISCILVCLCQLVHVECKVPLYEIMVLLSAVKI